MSSQRRLHLRVFGRVQGVFYRANARGTAAQLGLRGWVRNRDDGSVEAVAEGPDEALEAFIAWCRRGPAAARVERVLVEPAGSPDDLPASGFEVRH